MAHRLLGKCLFLVFSPPFLITVGEDAPLLEVMNRLRSAGASVALVVDGSGKVSGQGVRGLITKEQIAAAVIEGVELFSD